jgi:DNA-binding transcriptional MerR regulator
MRNALGPAAATLAGDMNVKEFAERSGLSPHTIRYYESSGLLTDVARLPNGHRCFRDRDLEWIEFVCRLKDTGMPLGEIRVYASLRAAGDSTLVERKRLLEAHAAQLKSEIVAQRRHLRKLEDKIATYDSWIDDAGPS